MEFISLLVASGVRLASVLGIASFGETISQRAGVLNIGIEGYMSVGAITGFIFSYYTGSPWIGLLVALCGGLVMSLVYAYLAIDLRVEQMAAGLGIMFLALGLMCLLNARVFTPLPIFPTVNCFKDISIPMLSSIPIIGPILFKQNVIIYITYALIPLSWYIVYRTKFGLTVRAVGESASATDAMGISVRSMRYISTLLCGALSGIAGGFLSLGVAHSFQGGMVAGRGFIVIAAVVMGNWHPLRVFAACFLFGLIDAFQYRMQILQWGGLPYSFWIMLPYIAAIVALVSVRRVRMPRELSVPYLRGRPE